MKFVCIDLHKKTISLRVVDQSRQHLDQKRFPCADESGIVAYFKSLGPFRAVVEATASYEWFVRLIEPYAEKVVLAHPKKLRVIAESTRKSDKLDATVLAEFLALNMIPQSYRPTQRQRDHRRLVRQRDFIQRRITSVKNRMRCIMTDYNADVRELFSQAGSIAIEKTELSPADRFAMKQMQADRASRQRRTAATSAQAQQTGAVSTRAIRIRRHCELSALLVRCRGRATATTTRSLNGSSGA